MSERPENNYETNLWATSTILFVTLLLGGLFNTDGLREWAKNKEVGVWRDDLITVTERFHQRMGRLALTKPREWIATAFDDVREGPGEVALAAKPPVLKEEKEIHVPASEAKKDSRKALLQQAIDSGRVLVAGDSMMHGALGKELKEQIRESGLGEPFVRAVIATGLARPDYFNWPKEFRRLYSTGPFGAAIIMLGGNDTQNIQVGNQKYKFGTPGWAQVYRDRVRQVSQFVCESTPRLFWVGAPLMRPQDYNRKVQLVNDIIKEEIESLPCAVFVPTVALMGGGQGYQTYLPVDGRLAKVRLNDGIHLTRSGGKIIARKLVKQLSRVPGFGPSQR